MGLLQGAIESAGMSTIGVTVRPEVTINMNVPRAVYVRFPTGNPVGEPHKPNQQRAILRGILAALEVIREPGTVLEMPYRWRRMGDDDRARQVGSAGDRDRSRPSSQQFSGREEAAAGARIAAETGPEDPPHGDLFAVAQGHTAAIGAAYEALLTEIERYRTWLEAQVAAERAKPRPDELKLKALNPQLTYVAELLAALEGSAHDGLVRVSDRAVRIKHWQDGVFI